MALGSGGTRNPGDGMDECSSLWERNIRNERIKQQRYFDRECSLRFFSSSRIRRA
jgi:hypothetical protein